MKKFYSALFVLSLVCSCQKEEGTPQVSQPTRLEFLTPFAAEDCEGDCGPGIVFNGCYMFEYSDTVALIRLGGLTGGYDVEEACYPEVGIFAGGMREINVAEYFHISGDDGDMSSGVMYVSGFCDADGSTVDWLSDQMVLVSISGEGEHRHVTNCVAVRDQSNTSRPEISRLKIELPSDVDELKEYLDYHRENYDTLCPPRAYEQDEQQQFFEKMLECSTYHPFPSQSEPDPCPDTRSEEEREACLQALEN